MSTLGTSQSLRRDVGLFGAVVIGLGSILGTGVFVSIGLAAGIAGPAIVPAIFLAGLVAGCNGMSSAQLAATHPVSGGTYEYGYRFLTPWLGFLAGWLFLLAKSASAATAALGFSGYLVNAIGSDARTPPLPIALAALCVLTLVALAGLKRGNAVNAAIVSATLAALVFFVLAGWKSAMDNAAGHMRPFFTGPAGSGRPAVDLLHAVALMFVAYTGYGRIATMGEEARDPRRTIPRAIILTLFVSMALYIAVSWVAMASVGAGAFYGATLERAAPLEAIAAGFGLPGAGLILAAGAMTAMLGVLLNLILGLSRVALAMGRRGDLPEGLGRIHERSGNPMAAVVTVAAVIGALILLGDIKATWSFSAFTVLIYYAITNVAALRLPRESRLYSPAFAWIGLGSCLGLAFFVEPRIWLIGLALMAAGLGWHVVARRLARGGLKAGE